MWSEEQRKAFIREQRKEAILIGFVSGQTIGTTAYTLTNFGRGFNPRAALGSGFFLGVILAVGSLMRTF